MLCVSRTVGGSEKYFSFQTNTDQEQSRTAQTLVKKDFEIMIFLVIDLLRKKFRNS